MVPPLENWKCGHLALAACAGAAAIEALTILCRFGFGLAATRDTASTIGILTCGVRIHHGYIGVLCLLAAWGTARTLPRAARALTVLGAALAASDLLHHFAVLWPLTGSPQWDWHY